MTEHTKKRILIFSLVYYPRFIGGAEVAVKELTKRLGDQYEFDMITLRKGESKDERIGSVNVHRVGFGWRAGSHPLLSRFKVYKYFFPFFACAKALSLHRTNHYDAIWSVMANYAGFGALFFKLLHPQVPFILNLQEGDPTSYIKRRVGVLYPLFKMIFTKADMITVLSVFLKEWAREMGATAPITIVPNGVDVRKFKVESSAVKEEETKRVRTALGFSTEDTLLITTSRLVEKNAVGDIIRSLAYLPENVKLLVVGTGKLLKNLQLITDTLQLSSRVHFLGFVPHEQLPPYLWASDIFVRPSLSEGQGASFMEAMGAGLPVIATPVGGIPDFLKDGETGLFCEVGNPKSIAQKIEKLMKDTESREYIIRMAETLVTEQYDWDMIAQKMRKELEETL